jgi:putative ABC transport system permease protein
VARLARRLKSLFSRRFRDRDMDDEMTFHVEALTRELIRGGMNAGDAARAARQRFGSVLHLKERGHDIRRVPVLEDLLRDVRYALRGLRRAPGFALAVVLTLAVGIGGNTAIFSVVDQLLLRPLPYPEDEQLVVVHESTAGRSEARRTEVSPANWLDWQRESRALRSLATWVTTTTLLTGVAEPVRLNQQLVSSEFFPVLGVPPLLGRTISLQDDQPNAPLVAVLSHALWQRQFRGDRGIIGRVIQLRDRPTEVIGVMPAGFRFVYQDNDVWGASRLDRNRPWRETSQRFLNIVGRLRPEVTTAAARTEIESIAGRLSRIHAFNRDTTAVLVPLREELTGPVSTSILMLYGAVGVLLSIACFNVANLLLARAAARRREIAVRTSLGAGRLAIVRQLVVESLVLAVAGGTLGIGLAHWSLSALVAFAPANLLRVPDLSVDRRVMLYALGLSVLTGLMVGLVPALSVARRSLAARMRAGGSATQSPRLRRALVVCQVAMTVVLLCGAGLLTRTLLALNGTNSGFDRRNILTMELTLPGIRVTPQHRTSVLQQAVEKLRALPGVEDAAAGAGLPVIGSPAGTSSFHRRGTPVLPVDKAPSAITRVVTPGYFRTLGVPVLHGREFIDADQAASAPPGFVVNDAFARRYLQEIGPLDAFLSVGLPAPNPHLPVIGIVGDTREGSVTADAQPTVYLTHRWAQESAMTLFVRTRAPEAIGPDVVRALRTLDPTLPVMDLQTLESAFGESVTRERLNALVSGAFAISGLLLASLGLYGLLAFLVTERTKEIGIRFALGAHRGTVTRSVIGGGIRLVAIGAAAGVAGSLLLSRWVAPLLFGVAPYDAATYASVLALLAIVTVGASYLPARRAARVEPLVALRQE